MAFDLGECIEWDRARTKAGYGVKWVAGRLVYTHRLTWERANGPIPDGRVIRHLCHNRACYRLDHLAVGTHVDNARDTIEAGNFRNGNSGKTECKHGHSLADAYLRKDGNRRCRTCAQTEARDRQRRRRAS